ncbi:MAG: DUF1338 domain-containing protein [Bacteroidetes bacterium]|nr:MAG: DUF1338 domain-containing protein [Bacteroidota bacterium]
MQNVFHTVLDSLMNRYKSAVPDVDAVLQALKQAGAIAKDSDIENDHIAFRTLGVPHLGVQSFEKIFLHHGYRKMDYYFFEEKKLDAWWYAPPTPEHPRIFISQLRVQDLSAASRSIIESYTHSITGDPVDALDLNDAAAIDHFLHSPLWPLPTLAHFEALGHESEYAAWVIYNRYYLNHYTISVQNLPIGFNTLTEFVQFLQQHDFVLNTAGGIIKTSPDGLLRQSSTVAKMVQARFAGGEQRNIAGSYVEFAERLVLPQFAHLPASSLTRSHRREGFEAQNADKIFESTYTEQTHKSH